MKLDEIAKIAGVSRTTASYVVNGKAQKYRISQATQDKVMKVVEKYQFKPNSTASALRVGSTNSIGLIIPDIENTSYAKIAKYLEQMAREHGYQVIICCSDDNSETEKKVVNTLISRNIDALIVASSLSPDDLFYPKLQLKGTPIIAIDRLLDDTKFSCVLSEDFNGALQLTKTLICSTTKSIALLGSMPDLSTSKQREQGFLSAISDLTLQHRISYTEHFCRLAAKEIILTWFYNNQLPDAIMITSYSLFEGILDAILLEPSISKKCKFATFGDNQVLNFLPFKVSSLAQQYDQISQKALEFTLAALNNKYQSGINLIERKMSLR